MNNVELVEKQNTEQTNEKPNQCFIRRQSRARSKDVRVIFSLSDLLQYTPFLLTRYIYQFDFEGTFALSYFVTESIQQHPHPSPNLALQMHAATSLYIIQVLDTKVLQAAKNRQRNHGGLRQRVCLKRH